MSCDICPWCGLRLCGGDDCLCTAKTLEEIERLCAAHPAERDHEEGDL